MAPDEFLARIAAFTDASDTYAFGRWTALARPELAHAAPTDVLSAAESIERTYYRVGDGDALLSDLVAVILAAQASLT